MVARVSMLCVFHSKGFELAVAAILRLSHILSNASHHLKANPFSFFVNQTSITLRAFIAGSLMIFNGNAKAFFISQLVCISFVAISQASVTLLLSVKLASL